MSNILNDLGIHEDDAKWYDFALCKGMDTNLFFDKYESDINIAKSIDNACLSCPVIDICYDVGKSENSYGVWGGRLNMYIDKNKDHFKYGINQWTGEPNKPVFYTQEMAKAIRRITKPVNNLQMDIVKYPEFLALRLYEDNFIQFEGIKKEMVIDYVSKVKKLLESYGVRCELEGVPSERVLR